MIEKTDKFAIPVVRKRAKRPRQLKYPYRTLEVGESFRVDGKPITDVGVSHWRAETGFNLISRTRYDDDGTAYVRIWRVA